MNGVAKGAQSTPSSTANSGLIDVFGHTDPSGATRAKTAAPPQQIQPPAQPQRIQSQQQSAMLVDFFGGAAAPTTTTAVDMFGFPVVSATPSAGQMSAASASTFQRQVSSSSSTAVAYGQTNSSFVTGTSAAAQNTTVALAGAAQPQAFQQRQGQNAVFSVPTNYIAQSQQPFGIAAPSSSAGGLGASPYIYASGAASQSALPSHMQRQPSNVSMNPSVSGNAPVANNPFDFFAQAPAAQQRPIVSQNSALTGNLFGEQQAYGRSSSTTSSPFAGSASLGHSSQTQLPMKAFGNAIGFPGVPATQQHPQQPLFGGQPQQPNARMPTNNANPFA